MRHSTPALNIKAAVHLAAAYFILRCTNFVILYVTFSLAVQVFNQSSLFARVLDVLHIESWRSIKLSPLNYSFSFIKSQFVVLEKGFS